MMNKILASRSRKISQKKDNKFLEYVDAFIFPPYEPTKIF